MATAQEAFKRFVSALAEVLREGGWRKSGNALRWRHGDLDQRIDLEKSMYSDRSLVKYRAWIQMGSPTIAEYYHLIWVPARKYAAIQFSQSIGSYLSDHSASWGTLAADDDPSAAARDFAQLLSRHVIPVLDQHSSEESLIEPIIARLRGSAPNALFKGEEYGFWVCLGVLLCTRGRGPEFVALADEMRAAASERNLVAESVEAVRREFKI